MSLIGLMNNEKRLDMAFKKKMEVAVDIIFF